MGDFLKGHFYNPTRGNLTLKEVVEEILYYVKEKPEKFYDIIIGCDSSSGETPHFPVAIVILRKGEGGRFFLKKINYKKSTQKFSFSSKGISNFHQRVLEEVLLSIQLALILKEELIKKLENFVFNYEFRYIHADIGENGATKDMIKEVIGLIKGNGFEPKIKPESFAASVVADRFT